MYTDASQTPARNEGIYSPARVVHLLHHKGIRPSPLLLEVLQLLQNLVVHFGVCSAELVVLLLCCALHCTLCYALTIILPALLILLQREIQLIEASQ